MLMTLISFLLQIQQLKSQLNNGVESIFTQSHRAVSFKRINIAIRGKHIVWCQGNKDMASVAWCQKIIVTMS